MYHDKKKQRRIPSKKSEIKVVDDAHLYIYDVYVNIEH